MLKVGIISLGCARNQVDSEVMLGSLEKSGFKIAGIEDNPDVCIVNTCAFLNSAREESIDSILDVSALKREGKIRFLVICGCLPQLYKERLAADLPEADIVLGTADFPKIAEFVKALRKGSKSCAAISRRPHYLYDENSPRYLLTPKHYTYVKISEGCSNFCSYCIISRLRGPFRSRSMDSVVKEVKKLSRGSSLKEINLIGQDTTLFGFDRYGKITLPELLKKICGLRNSARWIRILYTHPDHYTDELIATVRDEGKICKYLDLPVQHISDKILKMMNRKVTKKELMGLIDKLRRRIPGLALRTSVIVGFPGETEKDFNELLKFIRDTRFERLGAFIYSKEDGTRASRFGGHLGQKVKEERFDEVMKLQRKISRAINKSFIGKTIDVLIDEKIEGEKDRYAGRSQGDAPEVDGAVYVTGSSLSVGKFCRAKILGTMEYDLDGRVA